MKNLRYNILWMLFIAAVLLVGYVGFTRIDSGAENVALQKARQTEKELEETREALAQVQRELDRLLVQGTSAPAEPAGQVVAIATNTNTNSNTSSGAHASLISELEALRSRGAVIEPGDKGSAVSTVQKFLGVFKGKNIGVDGDFGDGTKALVIEFQEAAKTSADGGVGPTTLRKMIEWLEAN